MIKIIIYATLLIIGLLILFIGLYLRFSPQLGGASRSYDSPNYVSGKFKNLIVTPMHSNNISFFKILKDFIFNKHNQAFPPTILPSSKINKELLSNLKETDVAISWLGHSCFFIKTKEISIITDPVLGSTKLPPLNIGPKPFPTTQKYETNCLPKIDIVLISHDHYDHLDMKIIKQLKSSLFYVPLGVKAHLIRWGISEQNITEFDWYKEKLFMNNIKFIFAPSRHYSGRGLLNRNSTLWGAWIIELNNKKIFFSGDTGYFEEFKKIGKDYGPFDLSLLDCGQYNIAWQYLHMLPEEVVQAGIDLRSKAILPSHWGKYVLSLHKWSEPIERVVLEARKKGMVIVTPMIGETFLLSDKLPCGVWW
jgi:L-ascorbate metabolism protein UlaG (beta-lactamase superfamily)